MSSPSLLLVDDNPAYRRLTGLFAEEALAGDCELRVAGSLAEAEEALTERPADVVLLDLGLPDGEGLGNVERLAGHPGARAVVVLSGRSDDGIAAAVRAAGATAYVLKGHEVEDLAPALHAALHRAAG